MVALPLFFCSCTELVLQAGLCTFVLDLFRTAVCPLRSQSQQICSSPLQLFANMRSPYRGKRKFSIPKNHRLLHLLIALPAWSVKSSCLVISVSLTWQEAGYKRAGSIDFGRWTTPHTMGTRRKGGCLALAGQLSL